MAQMQRNFQGDSEAEITGSPQKVRELRAERDTLTLELNHAKTQLEFAAAKINSFERKNVRLD